MEIREELELIASNKPDEYQNSCNITRKGTKRKISQIVEQMDFTGNGYYHGRPVTDLTTDLQYLGLHVHFRV